SGGVLNLQDAYGSGNIEAFGGKIVMTTDGNIVSLGNISTQSVTITSDAVGSGVIVAGETSITIQQNLVNKDTKIFVTATTDTENQPLFVTHDVDGEFVVHLGIPLTKNVQFDYWVVPTVTTP
ncbi:hypothetical protein CO180_03280, partial [candidate division WWE3 bacterium CG_4_9_14_3_um_filter_41_6]